MRAAGDIAEGGAVDDARDDDVGAAVAIDVGRGDAHGTSDSGQGEEAADLRATYPVEDLDVAVVAAVGDDDDVVGAVAVDVARRHVHPAHEGGLEGEEAEALRSGVAVENLDVAGTVGRAGDDVLRGGTA